MTELSRLNLFSPLRTNKIFSARMSLKKSTKDTLKRFWRSISKVSLMAKHFSSRKGFGNILYAQAKLIRIFIRDAEGLNDPPITGYSDAFN
jgi:hypothetical protein